MKKLVFAIVFPVLDGSTRTESWPQDAPTLKVISIQNVSQARFYTFSPIMKFERTTAGLRSR
jgi:hypothetical protein